MLLLKYDFYDIHAVFVNLRQAPEDSHNKDIVKALYDLIDAPQIENRLVPNQVRHALSKTDGLDKEKWSWVFVDNCYTFGADIIKEEYCYNVISAVADELSLCIAKNDSKRFEDLADAVHNIPIYFADKYKDSKKLLRLETSDYIKKWNRDFLKPLI